MPAAFEEGGQRGVEGEGEGGREGRVENEGGMEREGGEAEGEGEGETDWASCAVYMNWA